MKAKKKRKFTDWGKQMIKWWRLEKRLKVKYIPPWWEDNKK